MSKIYLDINIVSPTLLGGFWDSHSSKGHKTRKKLINKILNFVKLLFYHLYLE